MDRISRRRFVVAVAGALATGGCLDAGGDPPSTDATTESMGTSTATPTATPESTSMATPTAETKRRDTLFIENVDQEEHTVEVEMTEQSPETNEPIVPGRIRSRDGLVSSSVVLGPRARRIHCA